MRFGEPRAVLLAVSMYLQWFADWFQLRSVVVYGWFPMGNLLFSWLFFWSAMYACLEKAGSPQHGIGSTPLHFAAQIRIRKVAILVTQGWLEGASVSPPKSETT